MTFSPESNQNQQNYTGNPQIKTLVDPEIIRAFTPMFIALIGGAIGITVLVVNPSDAGFTLASTALAGAAGLSQPNGGQKKK